MPFGKWPDFAACVAEISKRKNPKTGQPYGSETARKICGAIQTKSEKKLEEIFK